jgi:hypothetical protein
MTEYRTLRVDLAIDDTWGRLWVEVITARAIADIESAIEQ